MRKLIAFGFLAVALPFLSCSKKKDIPDVEAYHIVGTWELTKFKNDDGNWQDMTILGYYVQFNEDKTYKTNYMGVTLTGTYIYNMTNKIEVKTSVGSSFITIHSLFGSHGEAEMYSDADPTDIIEFQFEKQ